MNPSLFTLAEAAGWLSQARCVGAPQTAIARVHTDSRTLAPGDLFVALRGERFDGAQFLAQAATSGAAAALCEADAADRLQAAGLPGLLVPDARRALGELARGWRRRFALPLVAVTGSNGKTTVTQMVAAILRARAGDAAHATQGNLNNDVGLPLTLLGLRPHHRLAVVELGMNHPGEMAWLAAVAEPTVALVNNAQREHQEFMSSVEAVARENGAVLQALPDDGVAVFPGDDVYTPLWRQLAGSRPVLCFALERAAGVAVWAESAQWTRGAWQLRIATPQGPVEARLHIAGRHNVMNALAACTCALAAGVPPEAIARGLSAFEPVRGRSRALTLERGGRALTLIDDTYNANPDSVRALIEVLAELPGPRLLVLGDMGEVGDQGPAFHAEVGAHARARGLGQLFTLGELSRNAAQAFGPGARHFDDVAELASAAVAALDESATVAVKGSRFMRMERVVEALQAAARPAPDRQEGPHAA